METGADDQGQRPRPPALVSGLIAPKPTLKKTSCCRTIYWMNRDKCLDIRLKVESNELIRTKGGAVCVLVKPITGGPWGSPSRTRSGPT